MRDYHFLEKKFLVLYATIVLFVVGCICIIVAVTSTKKTKLALNNYITTLDLGVTAPETHYVPDSSYFSSIATANQPIEFFGETEVFGTVEDSTFIETEQSSFNETTKPQTVITNANQELYDLADRYFQVYYGSMRLSPMTPLAMANVETPGRADNSITWSALFPSRYVNISQLYSMDVTTVVSNDSIYSALSKEYSTRDRGALQMSPTYGTHSDYFNSLMSTSEKTKLANVDTSKYSSWASGAASTGDRFYVPDVCLRLSSAFTDAIGDMAKNNYQPQSDYQLLVMCAMYHQQSGVWHNSNHNKAVGKWNSGEKALEYSALISSYEFLNALKEFAYSHPDTFCLRNEDVKALYSKNISTPMTDYGRSNLVTYYPIKVEYAYIKLCIMYGRL